MQEREAAVVWVDELLVRIRSIRSPHYEPLLAEAASLPLPVQVGVLRECVKRMPAIRTHDHRDPAYHAGTALYDLACWLYTRKLPYDESDVCALLQTSQHVCGHGSDVSPPLDIALACMQKRGFSETVMAAVRQYLEGLRGVGSAQAQFAKRRAAIMLLADPAETPGSEPGWSTHFRNVLRGIPDAERAEWQRLVLSMKANDVYVLPATWRKTSKRLFAALPPKTVLERIEQWIAVDEKLATVRTGGSHVLKHLVWLLDELSADEELAPACDAAVVRIARTDWTPKDRAAKFMIAAAHYLSRRAPDALGDLEKWSGPEGGKIGEIAQRRRHL